MDRAVVSPRLPPRAPGGLPLTDRLRALGAPGPGLPLLVAGITLVALVALIVAVPGTSLRVVLALLVVADLLAVSFRSPTAAVVLTLAFLVVMAMLRRMVDALVGPTTYDPLLLIGPAVAVLIASRLFLIERRRLVTDRLSGAIALLLAITVLEVLNPESGVVAGALGLLFLAVPLIWFFLGRELATERTLETVMIMVLVGACASAAYGLFQTYVGLPGWDATWLASVEASGQYAALNVGGAIRSWGPFASAAEYAAMLAAGLAISVARLLHGRLLAIAAIPLLGLALFVESSRGVVILAVLAVIVMMALHARSARLAAAVLVVSAAAALAAQQVLAANVSLATLNAVNPLVSHQLGGLLDPFNPTQSTASLHLAEIAQAFVSSISHPLGLGTGSTSLAATHAGITSSTSEFDLSNAFTSLGLPGGILYCVVVAMALWYMGSIYRRRRTLVYAAGLGLLIVSFGQWLNGGYYALSALIWFVIGASSSLSAAPERHPAPAPYTTARPGRREPHVR
jgi:hypothetical protein